MSIVTAFFVSFFKGQMFSRWIVTNITSARGTLHCRKTRIPCGDQLMICGLYTVRPCAAVQSVSLHSAVWQFSSRTQRPNVVVEWLALPLHTRELPVSNPGPETDYPARPQASSRSRNIFLWNNNEPWRALNLPISWRQGFSWASCLPVSLDPNTVVEIFRRKMCIIVQMLVGQSSSWPKRKRRVRWRHR
jgi:hypothetical protein